jgi:hypothetical protein
MMQQTFQNMFMSTVIKITNQQIKTKIFLGIKNFKQSNKRKTVNRRRKIEKQID